MVGVVGSNPIAPTNEIKELADFVGNEDVSCARASKSLSRFFLWQL